MYSFPSQSPMPLHPRGPARPGLLQRKCACGGSPGPSGECEECRRKRLGTLQRQAAAPQAPGAVPPVVHQVLGSPGQPLDAAMRDFMEPRFGRALAGADVTARPPAMAQAALTISPVSDPLERDADALAGRALQPDSPGPASPRWDFSRVRVHADSQAAESARAVNALAYTVGPHVVFDAGRFAPQSHEGRGLLAHELAHTVQQLGPRLARQAPGSAKDKPNPLDRPLRPHIPQAPQMRSTGVPPGVKPCLTGAVCEPPVKGSATDFGAKSEEESKPRPKTPIVAKAVKKAAEDSAPGVLKDILEVTVNPGLSENVAAQVDLCKEFNVTAKDPAASCMEVPKHLEGEADRFNKGKECMELDKKDDDPMCFLVRDLWRKHFIELITHEAAHITFKRSTPQGISSRTSDKTTLHELSEMYAQFSEFPVHYRGVQGFVSNLDPKEARKRLDTSVKTWVQQHVESTGEGFLGMWTKIRCVNECEKATALIRSLVDSATAGWPEDMKTAMLQELSLSDKLNWPLPAPNLRPAPDPRPKPPPLYQPRRTFVPEIEKSLENLP